MGYETSYFGTIKIKDKSVFKKIEEKFGKDDEINMCFELEGIYLDEKNGFISISECCKIENELEEFCLFIASIDKGAFGEVECRGEDNDDFWKVEICDGEVWIYRGEITYNGYNQRFKSDKMDKKIYDITKNKTLLKKIVLKDLE